MALAASANSGGDGVGGDGAGVDRPSSPPFISPPRSPVSPDAELTNTALREELNELDSSLRIMAKRMDDHAIAQRAELRSLVEKQKDLQSSIDEVLKRSSKQAALQGSIEELLKLLQQQSAKQKL